jgi:hypothetical protein
MIVDKLTMIVRRENIPIFRLITVMALTATLLAHLSTFVGMHAGETIPLLDFILVGGVFALSAAFYKLAKIQWPENPPAEIIFALIPRWAKYIAGITLAYSFCEFAIHWLSTEGTHASIDGIYYLIGKNKHTMRQISYEEYRTLSTYRLRVYTGGLLPFYVWLTTGYIFCLR